jgi:hypothetical protein
MYPKYRQELIGLDKPTAIPLSLAANPKTLLRDQALTHEQHRLESVAEAMALVGVMTFQKALSGPETVRVGGAIFQFGRGALINNTVAAHCLPGQLEFNSLPLHTMPNWNEAFLSERGLKPLALSSKLRNVSARTDVVDRVVNQTDNLVEIMRSGRGLKPTLQRAVYGLMGQLSRRKPANWPAVEEIVAESMNYYRFTAGYACEERLEDLTKAVKLATSDSELQSLDYKVTVAEKYLEVTQDASYVPEATTLTGFLWVVKDVVEGHDSGTKETPTGSQQNCD